ncbi:FadR/GntR family transcriptional regulator [Allostreptomyces psammosilenae]|uniref:DNA-binding FadR family transcriptional regulator n=1 Tax=Allostreptomyces psammosilenae TaxID=1892865 RepID=A0A852ZW39_9ACTN|nr:FCD domain-containing protein [Allostreptomyces psammosilenae]NYI05470.1 DNA-binding FadR family transcriptional regulator [Allostreptomyces psammosilenae]
MAALQAASRRSLVDMAIDQLREQLAAGTWRIGDRLPTEHELATALQVGRNTVREAVRVLVHAGMLETRQGEGTFVTSLTDPSAFVRSVAGAGVRNVLEIRFALEAEAARLAARRRTPDDIARMRAALDRANAVRPHADRERHGPVPTDVEAEFVERDVDFHTAVVEAAHNPTLTELYRFFRPRVVEAIRDALGDRRMPDVTAEQHDELLHAIDRGDEEAAGRAVRRMLCEPLRAAAALSEDSLGGAPQPDGDLARNG